MNEQNQSEQNKSKDKQKFHCNKCGGKAFSDQSWIDHLFFSFLHRSVFIRL